MVNGWRSALAALLCLVAGCQTRRPPPEPASLAANMAEMEQHMNLLFRHIEQPQMLPRLRLAATHLLRLQQASAQLLPDGNPDQMRAFREGSDRSVEIIKQILAALSGGDLQQAQAHLLQLDRQRRECHSQIG